MDPHEGALRFARDEVLTEDSRLEDFIVEHWDALYWYDFDRTCWFVFS